MENLSKHDHIPGLQKWRYI